MRKILTGPVLFQVRSNPLHIGDDRANLRQEPQQRHTDCLSQLRQVKFVRNHRDSVDTRRQDKAIMIVGYEDVQRTGGYIQQGFQAERDAVAAQSRNDARSVLG